MRWFWQRDTNDVSMVRPIDNESGLLQPGDIVQLKSGGPQMTVAGRVWLSKGYWWECWYWNSTKFEHNNISSVVLLRKVSEAEKEIDGTP